MNEWGDTMSERLVGYSSSSKRGRTVEEDDDEEGSRPRRRRRRDRDRQASDRVRIDYFGHVTAAAEVAGQVSVARAAAQASCLLYPSLRAPITFLRLSQSSLYLLGFNDKVIYARHTTPAARAISLAAAE